jgi:16S rRNA (cytidine1402-2'-O)-methyltransferase
MTYSINNQKGTLYIVATPIGNLNDISFRAISTLKTVDLILAEDTRHATILLQHYQIHTPIESFHAHNEQKKSEHYINMLQKSTQIALISDAGTPLINDPGYPLVEQARKKNINVIPVPGPSALICALSAAGVPTDAFTFCGFPPAKSSARQKFFHNYLKNNDHTIIFYESTHRILDSLKDLNTVLDTKHSIIIAKELTKTYEQFHENTIDNILNWLYEDINRCKGEFVIIIPPRPILDPDDLEAERVLKILLEELSNKQAVHLCQKITGKSKNKLYDLAINLQKV